MKHQFLLIQTLVLAPAAGILAAPACASGTNQKVAAIAQHVFDARALKGFTGSAVIDLSGHVVFQKSYGQLRPHSGRKISRDAVFDIGSITKLLTKIAVLRLEQDGQLRLTDPLSNFFPSVPADKAAITVEQLLNHKAGFPDHHARDREVITRDQALKMIFARKLESPPGQKMTYSNTGYTVLAAIIEQASHKSFLSYTQGLLSSAGIRHTGDFSDPRFDRMPVTHTYLNGEYQGSPAKWRGPTWSSMGNGEFLSTALDLRTLMRALKDGKIIDPQRARTILGRAKAGSPLGRQLFWAGGGAGGNALLTYYPDSDLTVVILSNRMGWTDEPGKELQLIAPAEEAGDDLVRKLAPVLSP